jgi:hypothetical protein
MAPKEERQMTDHVDTNKLTAEVADGHGCAVLKAFDGLSLQEQISAMQDLAKGNGLKGGTSTSHWRYSDNTVLLELERVTPGIFNSNIPLFSETFDPIQRKIHYACTDTGAGTTQTIDKKF